MNATYDSKRRKTRRFEIECPITFSRFNSDRRYTAITKNHSTGGMYIESDHLFKPGTQILIHRETCSGPFDCTLCNGLNSMVLAEVKWTREIKASGRPGFGFGVKYTL